MKNMNRMMNRARAIVRDIVDNGNAGYLYRRLYNVENAPHEYDEEDVANIVNEWADDMGLEATDIARTLADAMTDTYRDILQEMEDYREERALWDGCMPCNI